jgi:hypothetical protein
MCHAAALVDGLPNCVRLWIKLSQPRNADLCACRAQLMSRPAAGKRSRQVVEEDAAVSPEALAPAEVAAGHEEVRFSFKFDASQCARWMAKFRVLPPGTVIEVNFSTSGAVTYAICNGDDVRMLDKADVEEWNVYSEGYKTACAEAPAWDINDEARCRNTSLPVAVDPSVSSKRSCVHGC